MRWRSGERAGVHYVEHGMSAQVGGVERHADTPAIADDDPVAECGKLPGIGGGEYLYGALRRQPARTSAGFRSKARVRYLPLFAYLMRASADIISYTARLSPCLSHLREIRVVAADIMMLRPARVADVITFPDAHARRHTLESPQLFTTIPVVNDHAEDDALEREQALVESAKHDPAAFATLYEQYFPAVYRYLRMRARQPEDAADLAQYVFLKALDALPRYQARSAPFVAWLFTIARHALIDRYRRHPSTISLDAAAKLVTDQEVEADVLLNETYARLAELLDALDSDARDLLALRFAAGLSAPEIAAIIGKRPEAVRKQLSRLLQSLKERYHATR